MIAKHFVLSNIFSVESDILRKCIQESLLMLKTFILLLHTLSANDSLVVHYKV